METSSLFISTAVKKKRNRTPFREICSQRFTLRQIETHRGLNSTESQVLNGCGSVGNSLTFSQKFLGLGAHDLMWMISALEFLCSNFCLSFHRCLCNIDLGNFYFFLSWMINFKEIYNVLCTFCFKNGMFCLFKRFPAHFMLML